MPIAEIDVGVPATLQRMIEAQLEHLTAEEQRALEVASVVGASFSSNAVTAVMKMEADFTESLFMLLSRGSYVVRAVDSQRLADGAVSQVFEFGVPLQAVSAAISASRINDPGFPSVQPPSLLTRREQAN